MEDITSTDDVMMRHALTIVNQPGGRDESLTVLGVLQQRLAQSGKRRLSLIDGKDDASSPSTNTAQFLSPVKGQVVAIDFWCSNVQNQHGHDSTEL